MAKLSSIEKNNRRKRLVAKFAAKRAALLAMANDRLLPQEERFAARLEHYCKKAPFQWFNFYDFWADVENVRR